MDETTKPYSPLSDEGFSSHEALVSSEMAEIRAKIAQEVAKEKELPKGVALSAFDFLVKIQGHKGAFPSKDEVCDLIRFSCDSQMIRWFIQKLPADRREKFLHGPANKVESFLETIVEGLLSKNKKVSLNYLTKMAVFYYKLPDGIARGLAKKVSHRIRERNRLFLSTRNINNAFKRFGIPPDEFNEMVEVGIIKAQTSNIVLEAIGDVLRHYHHASSRLRLTRVVQ